MKASLFKRAGRWHGKIQLDSWPTERRESLGTTDKRIAQIELEKRLRIHEQVAAGILAPTTVREARGRALESLCGAFLTDIQAESCTLGTAKKYRAALRAVIAANGWKTLANVTESGLRAWRRNSVLRLKTRNDYVAAWSCFGQWLKREKLIAENPAHDIEPLDLSKEAREYRRALTEAEAMRLLDTAPHPRCVFYRLQLETAIRPLEMRRLRVCDVMPANEGIGRSAGVPLPPAGEGEGARGRTGSCIRLPSSITKNGKPALQAITAALANELIALLSPDAHPNAPAFPGRVPNYRTFRKDLRAAGIAPADEQGRRVDMHALRKTAGTHMVLSGADPRVVMEFMRHSDLKLTMKTYMDAAQLAGPVLAAVQKLPWNRERNEAGERSQKRSQVAPTTGHFVASAVTA